MGKNPEGIYLMACKMPPIKHPTIEEINNETTNEGGDMVTKVEGGGRGRERRLEVGFPS